MAYEGGFQQGLANKIDIPSMKDQLLYYDKRLATERAQAEKQRRADATARQKAKGDRVKAARDKRKSLTDPTFEPTSIYDVNEMGNSIAKMAYQGMLDNEFAFQQGSISGDSYDRYMMNANSSVSKAQGVFTKIAALPEKAMELEAKGQGSIINDWHQGTIAKYGKYAKPEFSSEGDLKLTTLSGENDTLTMDMGQFSGLAQPVVGVGDLKKFVNGIADDKGYSEYLFKDKSGKVIDYTLNLGQDKERLGELFDSTVNGYSEYQVIEAAVKMGVTGKEKGKVDVNQDNYLEFATNPDKIKDLRAKVKSAMVDDLQTELSIKQGSRIYAPKDGDGGGSKENVVYNTLKMTDAAGNQRKVEQGVPKRNVDFKYLVVGTDSAGLGMAGNQGMKNQLEASLNDETGVPIPVEAIKNVTLLQQFRDEKTGAYQFEFGYDYEIDDTSAIGLFSDMTSDALTKLAENNLNKASDQEKENIRGAIDSGDTKVLVDFLGRMAPKKGGARLIYRPNSNAELNEILIKSGQSDRSISDAKFEDAMIERNKEEPWVALQNTNN